jgi:single-stranded DNA-specific DHH superfamily exonuclease
MPPDKQLMRRVQTGAPNKIVWLDMAVDQMPSLVQRMSGFAEQLVIDHHVILNDLSKMKGIIHYNPRFRQKSLYQSTTYIMWKLLADKIDEDVTWLAATGAVADYDLKGSEDLVREIEKRWNIELFQKLANMIESTRLTKTLNFDQLVERLTRANGPSDITEDESMIKTYHTIESEIETMTADAEASGELIDGVFFYEAHAKHNVKSKVATKLSEKWPARIIVIHEKKKSNINASIRSHAGSCNLSVILRKAAKDISGASAGGHEAAGGATVPEKEWNNFKQKLVEVAKTYKK